MGTNERPLVGGSRDYGAPPCLVCGQPVPYGGRGRRPQFHQPHCWEIWKAQDRLSTLLLNVGPNGVRFTAAKAKGLRGWFWNLANQMNDVPLAEGEVRQSTGQVPHNKGKRKPRSNP